MDVDSDENPSIERTKVDVRDIQDDEADGTAGPTAGAIMPLCIRLHSHSNFNGSVFDRSWHLYSSTDIWMKQKISQSGAKNSPIKILHPTHCIRLGHSAHDAKPIGSSYARLLHTHSTKRSGIVTYATRTHG